MKLNVGCGDYLLVGWVNIDSDPAVSSDRIITVPPIPYADGAIDAIWGCHFLEHLPPREAREFLRESYRCLKPGGSIGLVVPDTREIMRRYVDGAIDAVEYGPRQYWPIADLDSVCALFLYSTAQGSAHHWSYDGWTLRRAMEGAGFVEFSEVNRYADPRLGSGQWYQCGWSARKPG